MSCFSPCHCILWLLQIVNLSHCISCGHISRAASLAPHFWRHIPRVAFLALHLLQLHLLHLSCSFWGIASLVLHLSCCISHVAFLVSPLALHHLQSHCFCCISPTASLVLHLGHRISGIASLVLHLSHRCHISCMPSFPAVRFPAVPCCRLGLVVSCGSAGWTARQFILPIHYNILTQDNTQI